MIFPDFMRTFATNSIIMNNLRDNSLMTFKAKFTHFFALPFWRSWTTITVIYALIPIIIGLLKWHKNNLQVGILEYYQPATAL